MEIKDKIFELENRLQQPDVRRSPELLNDLISEDLTEFGSSGQMYTKNDVLVNLPSSPEIKFIMSDFRINVLSDNVVQSLFKTEKTNLENGKVSKSLRCSVWRNENGKWRMIFHQGTPFV